MPKTQKLKLLQRTHAANKLIYNVGVKQTQVAIEKKKYGGDSGEPSTLDGDLKAIRFNTLTKSLDADEALIEVLQTVSAPLIAIA